MGFFDSIVDTVSDVWHEVTGTPTAADRRKNQQLMQDQINAYKQQTALAESEMKRAREERLQAKKRLDEKQIRSLRRSNRSAGFMDSGNEGLSSTLGA